MLADQRFAIRPLPNIVFGLGAAQELAGHAAALELEAVLVVTDSALRATGILDAPLEALRAGGVAVEMFDGVDPNPTDTNVEAGAARLRTMSPSAGVLAFGGGSSIDCGKAVALLARNGEAMAAVRARNLKPGAPVIAVPTTAGTGSETNGACVITDSKAGRKTYVMHGSIVPSVAVLDPALTLGLPRYPTATCGFDVLTHAIEAYVSARATPYSDGVALEAIHMAAGHLRRVVADGSDVEARSQMLMASAMAAVAFNVAGLGAAHGTGHALSARFGTAHGQTLATMLPHVMRHNMPVAEAKYARVGRILAPEAEETGMAAIGAVERLVADLGLDRRIAELGGDEAMIPVLVDDATADFVNRTNPRSVDPAVLEALYRAAW